MKKVILKSVKLIINVLIGICVLLIFIDILWFAYGSLEMFPTKQRMSDTRLATAFIAIILIIIGCGLILIRKVYRNYLNDNKYPEEYFKHYIAMFQSEIIREGFISYAKLCLDIEGINAYENLIEEILLIDKNNDWEFFVIAAKEYEMDKLSIQEIKELAKISIDIFNQYKEDNDNTGYIKI